MKTFVGWVLRQRERKTLGKFTIGLLAAVFFGLAGLVACNDKDQDEQQSSASKAVAGPQTAAQKRFGQAVRLQLRWRYAGAVTREIPRSENRGRYSREVDGDRRPNRAIETECRCPDFNGPN